MKCSSAQITVHYKPEDLLNRLIVGVTNFPRKQIADFFSEVLVLGSAREDGSIDVRNCDSSPLRPKDMLDLLRLDRTKSGVEDVYSLGAPARFAGPAASP